ncbi:MAG TPA: hypothetical protein VMY87_01465, partial [Armatimonadota bacterium]|nr:hypothetical protein [Armatimonadota bacterium]
EDNARFGAGEPDAPTADDLLSAGQNLLAAGCDDPLILYSHGYLFHKNGRAAEAEPIVSRALEGLQKSRYPKCQAAFAALRRVKIALELSPGDESKLKEYRDLAIELVAQAAVDGSYARGEERLFIAHLEPHWGDVFADRGPEVVEVLKATPGIDPYVTHAIEGQMYINLAWQSRGGGWADSVSPEGWRGFERRLDEARRLLVAAWKMHPEYPEAPTAMITIAMAGHAEEPARLWFDRAVAAQMDYEPAYDAYMTFLRPRWHGSTEEMYELGIECLKTKRFDTETPMWFFHTLLWINEDLVGDTAYWRRPETYEALCEMFDGYESVRPERELNWYRSVRAVSAWRAGQHADARRVLDSLGENAERRVSWQFFWTRFEEIEREVHAYTSASADKVAQAADLRSQLRRQEAAAIYEGILKAGEPDPLAAEYVRHELASVRLEEDFAAGKWVDLLPPPSLDGWPRRRGTWTVGADGALTGTAGEDGLWLESFADFGRRLELKGEIEFVSSPTGCKTTAGVGVGRQPTVVVDILYFLLTEGEPTAIISERMLEDCTFRAPAEVRRVNSFSVRLWDDRMTVYVNGQLAHNDVAFERLTGTGKAMVALGATAACPGSVVRYRDLQIRLLERPPAP